MATSRSGDLALSCARFLFGDGDRGGEEVDGYATGEERYGILSSGGEEAGKTVQKSVADKVLDSKDWSWCPVGWLEGMPV